MAPPRNVLNNPYVQPTINGQEDKPLPEDAEYVAIGHDNILAPRRASTSGPSAYLQTMNKSD